jgi:hypothetical protein
MTIRKMKHIRIDDELLLCPTNASDGNEQTSTHIVDRVYVSFYDIHDRDIPTRQSQHVERDL